MEIRRDKYLNQLISKRNNGLIKVITGIRRSGKSYLLFNIFYKYLLNNEVKDNQIIKIALDDDDQRELRDPDRLKEYIKQKTKGNRQYYIFIDEVQFAISKEELKDADKPIRLYGILNGLLRNNNLDVYVTGSNSKLLSKDVMTEFRGRGDEINVMPLSFSEFYDACGKDERKAYREYSLYGGMPYILSLSTDKEKINYLNHLNKEIYIKDIVDRYEIRNDSGLESLMKIVSSSISSLINPQKLSNTYISNNIKGMSQPTIKNYLNYLEEAFIVNRADRYDIKGKKYISTPSKYYYSDIGLRNDLINFRQDEPTHIMENIIYNELRYRDFSVDIGVVEINESVNRKHTNKQLEVDFICHLGNDKYYIQSAYTIPNKEKMVQETKPLNNIPDSFKKIIVVSDDVSPYRNEDGILVINIIDFLLNKNSLNL